MAGTEGTQNQNQNGEGTQGQQAGGLTEARVLELIQQAKPAIDKGLQQKESAIMKSFFEQQGLTAEEATQAMNAWKQSKQTKAQEEADKITNMQKENETLKAQILQGKVDAVVTAKATELGVDATKVQYVTKLADLKGAINDKGEIDEAKVKTALEAVLKDIPEFKTKASDGSGAGFQIGGKGDSAGGGKSGGETQTVTAQKRWNRFN